MQQQHFPTPEKYDFWIKNNLNVLFIGKAGIGKTETVKAKFNEHFKDRWMYISASTMDPWVDLIGVPREVIDEKTGKPVLELVRPRQLENDEVEAIMIDEYNRAPAKVRNAIMELIQFRSINGKKFKNLKIVWAAINPDDDETYDVERLDPAQKDRFPIHVYMPYVVNYDYFISKHGPEGRTACQWWDHLKDDVKDQISPRRLDYALDVFNMGGELTYVLPYVANLNDLITQLMEGSIDERLNSLYLTQNKEECEAAFANENFIVAADTRFKTNKEYKKFFIHFYPKDRLIAKYIEDEDIRSHFEKDVNYRLYQSVFDPVVQNYENNNKKINGTEVQYSTISAIKRWRDKHINATELSDVQFIQTVSDTRTSIEYLVQPAKQNDVINKFGEMLNSGIPLTEAQYLAMFGVSVELLHRVNDKPAQTEALYKTIGWIGQRLAENGFTNLTDAYTEKLVGLRAVKNTSTIFKAMKQKLIERGLIEDKATSHA